MDIGVYCVEPAVALFGRPSRVLSASVTAPVPGCSDDDPYRTIDLALLGFARIRDNQPIFEKNVI